MDTDYPMQLKEISVKEYRIFPDPNAGTRKTLVIQFNNERWYEVDFDGFSSDIEVAEALKKMSELILEDSPKNKIGEVDENSNRDS